MQKRYLTVDRATERLPKLSKLLSRLVRIEKSLEMAEEIEVEYDDFFDYATHQVALNKAYHKLWYEYYKILEQVHKMGAIVKDVQEGVIDFFSIHEGREILLCWQIGDPKIRYWHEIDEGFDQKKSVTMLKKARV